MAFFASASSQRLASTAALVTAVPWSAGFWVMPTTSGADQDMFTHSNTGSTTNYFSVFRNASNLWGFDCNANEATVGTVLSGAWHYILVRAISATNRRLSVISSTGAMTHAQSVVSATPTGINVSNIGALHRSSGVAGFLDGHITELWISNADIQGDGAQLQDSLLNRIAFEGPFSLPLIAADIIQYRRLAVTLGSDTDKMGEVFYGRNGLGIWTNTNAVTMGPAPPLSRRYIRPQRRTPMILV